MVLSTSTGVHVVGTLLVILTSYCCILSPSSVCMQGRGGASLLRVCVSPVLSHLLLHPPKTSSSYSPTRAKVASMFCAAVIPMLDPLIYSLRNEAAKVLWNVIKKMVPLFLGIFPKFSWLNRACFEVLKLYQTYCFSPEYVLINHVLLFTCIQLNIN